ncbi:uncharacterized protein LY89DRAFT_457971 [Mollisia scopiformis]|uniref:Uncharacterized protein n=1 Tax=Mollisia scopiformis TaxID=149040 RepID=A0A194XHQ2_MOLSC|nr:uncharacterized protein LY89DRAFT_457971 [Mollisia scopiformis]KUJ19688.1 hypothetical protein LY89DRAFT_457971 [Mollisia scopiformis]
MLLCRIAGALSPSVSGPALQHSVTGNNPNTIDSSHTRGGEKSLINPLTKISCRWLHLGSESHHHHFMPLVTILEQSKQCCKDVFVPTEVHDYQKNAQANGNGSQITCLSALRYCSCHFSSRYRCRPEFLAMNMHVRLSHLFVP